MLQLICFLVLASFIIPGESYNFHKELRCRDEFGKISDGLFVYAFVAVLVVLSFLQLIAVSIAVWYIKKKLCSQVDEVVEKTHTVMDAVLVSLLPQNVTIELAVPVENKKKGGGSKQDKKSAE